MKLSPFVERRLVRGLITLGVVMCVIALALLVVELREAKALRDMKAENDAKVRPGEADIHVPWGWGNSGELRPEYTYDEVKAGVLGDKIVLKAASEHGVAIGFNELDGSLPGGGKHAAYVTILVKVVFD